jgi:polysaccharide biosynthesis/export protein
MRILLCLLSLIGVAQAQRLSPGDHIRLICEQEPTLSVERVLSPTGVVTLPIIGSLNLGGKFLVEAEVEMERLAAQKLGSDRVKIAVALITDESSPVEFSGAVKRNGSIPFRSGMTLADIVRIAEPTIAAASDAVEITGGGGRKIVVDLNLAGGQTKLRPGDRVYFPLGGESPDVLILGGVTRPGSRHYVTGLTLLDLLKLAGGVTGHGQKDRVRVERKGKDPITIDLNKPDADIPILRGDVVVVPIIADGRFVAVNGFVGRPGLVEYRPGMTLADAIKAAGGMTPFSGVDAVTVKRLGAWKKRFDCSAAGGTQAQDLVLEPDDVIEIPAATLRKAPGSHKPVKSGGHPVIPPL